MTAQTSEIAQARVLSIPEKIAAHEDANWPKLGEPLPAISHVRPWRLPDRYPPRGKRT